MKMTPSRNHVAAATFFVVMAGCLGGVSATEKQIADLEEDIAALKVELEEVSASGGAATQLLSNIETAKAEIENTKTTLPEKEDIAAATTAAPAAPSSGSAGTTAAVAASPPAPQLSQTEAYQQIQQRNAGRQKQIIDIKARYAQLFAEKKKARSDKAADDAGFRSAKIKKSKNEIDATMSFHNSRIAKIEEEEASLRTEIARIQSEFE